MLLDEHSNIWNLLNLHHNIRKLNIIENSNLHLFGFVPHHRFDGKIGLFFSKLNYAICLVLFQLLLTFFCIILQPWFSSFLFSFNPNQIECHINHFFPFVLIMYFLSPYSSNICFLSSYPSKISLLLSYSSLSSSTAHSAWNFTNVQISSSKYLLSIFHNINSTLDLLFKINMGFKLFFEFFLPSIFFQLYLFSHKPFNRVKSSNFLSEKMFFWF